MVTFTGKELSANAMTAPALAIQEIAVISSTPFVPPSAYAAEVLADSPIFSLALNELSGATAVSRVEQPHM